MFLVVPNVMPSHPHPTEHQQTVSLFSKLEHKETYLPVFGALTHYDSNVAPGDGWNVVIDVQDLDGDRDVSHHTGVI